MGFSSTVKEELSKTSNLNDKEAVRFELLGYLISNNCKVLKNKIQFKTGNEYNINRFNKLLINCNIEKFKIEINSNKYSISFNRNEINKFDEIFIDSDDNNDKNNDKIVISDKIFDIADNDKNKFTNSFIRGAFMGSGTMNDPNKNYHLEIIFSNEENCRFVKTLLNVADINIKEISDKNILYLKDGQEISKILALMGASSAVIKFEEIRVVREVKNNINRKVNLETANLQKTIKASVKQINKIKELQESGEFEKMPESLQEIGRLRLENPDKSIEELGKMLEKPLGKSGANHRMNEILNWN